VHVVCDDDDDDERCMCMCVYIYAEVVVVVTNYTLHSYIYRIRLEMLASTMRATMPLSRGIMFNVSKNKNASIFDQMMGARGMAYMNRRKRGLYGKKETRYGNNVSHSLRRTRRVWRPNIQWKRYVYYPLTHANKYDTHTNTYDT